MNVWSDGSEGELRRDVAALVTDETYRVDRALISRLQGEPERPETSGYTLVVSGAVDLTSLPAVR